MANYLFLKPTRTGTIRVDLFIYRYCWRKTLDPTVDNQLKDVVWVKGEAIEIGHTYTVFTQYKNTKTGEVVSEATSTYTPKNKEDTFEVFLELKANILKDSDQLTATHVLYYEEEQKKMK